MSEADSTSIPKSICSIDSSLFPESPSILIKTFVTSVLYPKSPLSWCRLGIESSLVLKYLAFLIALSRSFCPLLDWRFALAASRLARSISDGLVVCKSFKAFSTAETSKQESLAIWSIELWLILPPVLWSEWTTASAPSLRAVSGRCLLKFHKHPWASSTRSGTPYFLQTLLIDLISDTTPS